MVDDPLCIPDPSWGTPSTKNSCDVLSLYVESQVSVRRLYSRLEGQCEQVLVKGVDTSHPSLT